jgi:Probable lipoprotein LpqN
MIHNARVWSAIAGATAAAVAGVVALSGVNAGAEPTLPLPPAPATVTQTVTVTPAAAPNVAVIPSQPQANSLAVPSQNRPGALAGSPVIPTATPTLVPATSGTLRDFFKSKGVTFQPQKAPGFAALNITFPVPPGWTQVPDPNVPDAFMVIANRNAGDLYTPNAQLVVYKLVGDFDPKEAITHGFVDSQQLLAWQTTSASLADFGGFPSSLIEGTYRLNEQTLNTSRRNVIATSGPDRYLVSLAVSTSVAQAVAAAPATDAIVTAFRVAAPAPAAPPGSPSR